MLQSNMVPRVTIVGIQKSYFKNILFSAYPNEGVNPAALFVTMYL